MQISVKNLGAIKEASIALRPLTVIIGPNNTNKTHLAYCIYGLIKHLSPYSNWTPHATGSVEVKLSLDEIVEAGRAATQPPSEPRLRDFFVEYFQDSYAQLFGDVTLRACIDKCDARHAIDCLAKAEGLRVELRGDRVIAHARRSKHARDNVLKSLAGWTIRYAFTRNCLALPAERNAFVITYKVLTARRYRIIRDRQRPWFRARSGRSAAIDRENELLREHGDIRYPAPVEDFLDFLYDVELRASTPPRNRESPFHAIADLVESQIQSGHKTEYTRTRLGGSELTLRVDESTRLDLYNASSSIKQLAPLLLFLRHRAEEGHLLIIDEPEMNLHPEAQARLLEALSMMTNLGVRIILTTHSPYILTHLNSLISGDPASVKRRNRQAQHLYTQEPNAFIARQDVAAYGIRDNTLEDLSDSEYGIRWDTLSDVSSDLQQRYFAIIEEPHGRKA